MISENEFIEFITELRNMLKMSEKDNTEHFSVPYSYLKKGLSAFMVGNYGLYSREEGKPPKYVPLKADRDGNQQIVLADILETCDFLNVKAYGIDDDEEQRQLKTDEEGRVVLGQDIEMGDIDIGDVHLLDTSDVQINPSTEDTLQALHDLVDAEDFAQEVTLSSINSKVATEDKQDDIITELGGKLETGESVKLEDIMGDLLNPATEETLDTIKEALDVDLSTLASETTADAIRNAVEATLDIDAVANTIGLLEAGDLNLDVDNDLGIAIQKDLVGLFTADDFTEDRNIDSIGGTEQTGADWTPLLQNLDIGLSDIQTDIQNLQTDVTNLQTAVETQQDRKLSERETITNDVVLDGSIETPITQDLVGSGALSLFMSADGAIDITLELSPDGSHWYEVDTVEFTEAGDTIYEIGYRGAEIRFTGSNATNVSIQTFEVV